MMLALISLITSLLLLLSSVQARDNELRISAPSRVPPGASKFINHGYASFSFPMHWFADYAGNASDPNLFSRDILDLLYNKTGAHPQIRVGGTSADRTIVHLSQEQSIVVTEGDNGIPATVTVNEDFFTGLQNFPGSRWVFQVNLANNQSDRVENALLEARLALKYLGGSLDAFEIGNEPDLYPGDVRAADYSVKNYVAEWQPFADVISKEVLKGNEFELEEWRLFQALTFATNNASTNWHV